MSTVFEEKRKVKDNGCYYDYRKCIHSKEGQRIPEGIVKDLKRQYNILEVATSEINLEDNLWTIRGEDRESDNRTKDLKLNFVERCFYDLLSEVGISRGMANKFSLELLQHNFNTLKQNPETGRLVIERDGNVITNIFTMKANFFPMELAIKDLDEKFNQILVSDADTRLLLTTPATFDVKKVGDIHHLGWTFNLLNRKNSSKIYSDFAIFRLKCTNGITGVEEELKFPFSRGDAGDYQDGIREFIKKMKDHDLSEVLKRIEKKYSVLYETVPTTQNLIEIFKACRSIEDSDFADSVIGWSSDDRKDIFQLVKGKTKNKEFEEKREEILNERNDSYGTVYDIYQRITDNCKNLSVSAQIELQDYVGKELRERDLN